MALNKYKEKIIKLRIEGYSLNEIANILGCSKSTVSYNLYDKSKISNRLRRKKFCQKAHPYSIKLTQFSIRKNKSYKLQTLKSTVRQKLISKINLFCKRRKLMPEDIKLNDVIEKFGENPVCYLTGVPIDINKTSTYHFDHIIPTSKGGSNKIDNLGICTKQANLSKTDMSYEEYIEFCRNIVNYYDLNKKVANKATN